MNPSYVAEIRDLLAKERITANIVVAPELQSMKAFACS